MGIEKLYSLYGNTISKRCDWDWFIVGIGFYFSEVI